MFAKANPIRFLAKCQDEGHHIVHAQQHDVFCALRFVVIQPLNNLPVPTKNTVQHRLRRSHQEDQSHHSEQEVILHQGSRLPKKDHPVTHGTSRSNHFQNRQEASSSCKEEPPSRHRSGLTEASRYWKDIDPFQKKNSGNAYRTWATKTGQDRQSPQNCKTLKALRMDTSPTTGTSQTPSTKESRPHTKDEVPALP